jgi:hypothetical protein
VMKSDEILIKTFDQVKNDNFDQVKFDQVIVCLSVGSTYYLYWRINKIKIIIWPNECGANQLVSFKWI